jgi:hypothetical protein
MQSFERRFKMDIYCIEVKVTYKTRLFKIKEEDYYWMQLVYENSEEEAINKYRNKYRWNLAGNVPLFSHDVKRDIVCTGKNKYGIDTVKYYLTSDEFIAYCKERFGLNEFLNRIV